MIIMVLAHNFVYVVSTFASQLQEVPKTSSHVTAIQSAPPSILTMPMSFEYQV